MLVLRSYGYEDADVVMLECSTPGLLGHICVAAFVANIDDCPAMFAAAFISGCLSIRALLYSSWATRSLRYAIASV